MTILNGTLKHVCPSNCDRAVLRSYGLCAYFKYLKKIFVTIVSYQIFCWQIQPDIKQSSLIVQSLVLNGIFNTPY